MEKQYLKVNLLLRKGGLRDLKMYVIEHDTNIASIAIEAINNKYGLSLKGREKHKTNTEEYGGKEQKTDQ